MIRVQTLTITVQVEVLSLETSKFSLYFSGSCISINPSFRAYFPSGSARPQNLGGYLRGKLIFWEGKIEFLKRYCYLPMPLSQDFCPPPRRFAPLSKGGDTVLRIPPPGDEYPRNIAPSPEGRMPQEYRPPLGYSPPIYAMWFIQIIS
jgi:hypothetical protein